MLDKAIKKIDKAKGLEVELKAAKEERAKIEEEVRRLNREKAQEKELQLKIQEDKIKIQAEKVDLETKIITLIKDNQTLESNLKDLTKSTSNSSSSSETDMQLKILTIEKERDQLKWNSERQELHNRISEYKDLIISKDNEYKMKGSHDQQRLKDEV